MLALRAGACGGKSTASQLHPCAPDGAAWVSVPSPEADAGTAAAKLSCPGSISDYCNLSVSCPPATWTAAIAEQNALGFPPELYVCDTYNWAEEGWSCGGTSDVLFAYDKTTGKLVGAVELSTPGSPNQQICLAGPATMRALGSCSAYFDCFPNDASFPQGRCYGDGGVDAPGDGG